MPGQLGNSGGKRGRSGRKSKAAEMGLQALLDYAWPPAQRAACIQKLVAMAEAGNLDAAKLLLAYTFGKPPEHITVNSAGVTVRVVYVQKGKDGA